ncbi:unnamed protein product, partial [Musa acuminata subsp. burmannicoides]
RVRTRSIPALFLPFAAPSPSSLPSFLLWSNRSNSFQGDATLMLKLSALWIMSFTSNRSLSLDCRKYILL